MARECLGLTFGAEEEHIKALKLLKLYGKESFPPNAIYEIEFVCFYKNVEKHQN